jgi:hypothetical protein
VAGLNGDPVRNIVRYADRWCPWMGDDELAVLVRRVLARPYRWRGDTLGEKIGLIDAVRTKLRITTIGAIDVPKPERERRRRERWNAKRRKLTREQYLADTITKAEPWKAEGVSRATWYRRRETGPRQQTALRKVTHTCLTPTPKPAAPPQRSRALIVAFFSALSPDGASPSSAEVGLGRVLAANAASHENAAHVDLLRSRPG